ncbi:3-oxoacyl-ACP reductase FabG [Candidatus Aerophobetes bacterium]|nr:3-oxoacyl-ACP reductase FabG [Candidatus Aerophobetes bacterium]
MDLKLKDKVAIVTGAARGIGKVVAETLAEEGAKVVIADIDVENGKKTEEKIKKEKGDAFFICVDVAKKNEVKRAVDKVIEKFGKIDILINNAAICYLTPLEEITEEEWDRVMNINLKGVFNFSQVVIKHMKERKYGKIINIASVAGKDGGVVGPHYSISKAGVICLTKCFARYGAKYGINVNTVSPGPCETEMTKNWPESLRKARLMQTPLGKFARPEDIAGMVAFLASDLSSHITGENVDINGGILMD